MGQRVSECGALFVMQPEADSLVGFWCQNISSHFNFNFPFNFGANLRNMVSKFYSRMSISFSVQILVPI